MGTPLIILVGVGCFALGMLVSLILQVFRS